jgi:hypothetical protein
MSEFIEECRREWKRLHVPDSAADEMAADLAADLQEAEVEGAAPEELLGEAALDPHTFARSWAQERGLVGPGSRRLRHLRLSLALAAAVIVIGGGIAAGLLLTRGSSQNRTPSLVAVPNLVGMKRGGAIAAARRAGLSVTIRYRTRGSGRSGSVASQTPSPRASVRRGATLSLVVRR